MSALNLTRTEKELLVDGNGERAIHTHKKLCSDPNYIAFFDVHISPAATKLDGMKAQLSNVAHKQRVHAALLKEISKVK
ncbi:hypothetical protein K6R49_003735 [Escherichia coli]|uniref:hypothetical protein n=1 Tax=Buttiauxella noackiae TaxID=82992 RepID=UPI0019F17E85|nr:hypothetical protein [Escherichia coli]MBJ0329703.1 hypothetical protein [Escherichia coli]